jgi:hypothetical protein
MGQFQQIDSSTLDGLTPIYESAARQQQGQKGFVSTQLLADRAARRWMVVTLFETLADLEASETAARQALSDPRVAVTLAGPPVVAVYEVVARVVAATE